MAILPNIGTFYEGGTVFRTESNTNKVYIVGLQYMYEVQWDVTNAVLGADSPIDTLYNLNRIKLYAERGWIVIALEEVNNGITLPVSEFNDWVVPTFTGAEDPVLNDLVLFINQGDWFWTSREVDANNAYIYTYDGEVIDFGPNNKENYAYFLPIRVITIPDDEDVVLDENSFRLANRIKIQNKSSNIDYYYGIYISIEQALETVIPSIRRKGKSVGVLTLDGVVEYWFKNGIEDTDLIIKNPIELVYEDESPSLYPIPRDAQFQNFSIIKNLQETLESKEDKPLYTITIDKIDAVWKDDFIKVSISQLPDNYLPYIKSRLKILTGEGIVINATPLINYSNIGDKFIYLKDVDGILSIDSEWKYFILDYTVENTATVYRNITNFIYGENVLINQQLGNLPHAKNIRHIFNTVYTDFEAIIGISNPFNFNWTVNTTDNTLISNIDHNLSLNDEIYVEPLYGVLPTEIIEYTKYYVVEVVSSKIIKISDSLGGIPIDIIDSGTNGWYVRRVGLGNVYLSDLIANGYISNKYEYLKQYDINLVITPMSNSPYITNPPNNVLEICSHSVNTYTRVNKGTTIYDFNNSSILVGSRVDDWITSGTLNQYTYGLSSFGYKMEFFEEPLLTEIEYPLYNAEQWSPVYQQSAAVAVLGAKFKMIRMLTGLRYDIIRLAAREAAVLTNNTTTTTATYTAGTILVSIVVASTTDFPNEGAIKINGQMFWYSAKTSNSFTLITAANQPLEQTINSGATVSLRYDIYRGFGRVVVSNVLDYIKNNIKNGEFQTNIAKQTEYLKGLPSSLQYEAMYPNTPVSKKMLEERISNINLPNAQIQADWAQEDTIALDYIKNKPNIPEEVTVGNLITNATTTQSPSAGEAFTANITLHEIAKTGDYNDLLNLPSIPDAPGTLDSTQTTAQATNASEPLSGAVTLHKVAKTGTYSDLIGIPDIRQVLLSVTDAPTTFTTGDKYYNSTDNKIYTALSNSTWDAGVVPTKGMVYIYDNNNYLYDKGSILKIYTVKCADLVEVDELSVIEPDLNYDIIQYKLVTGATDQLLDTFTNLPEHSCTKIIEFENTSGVDKSIVISTTPIVDTYYTYNIVNYRESSILLETGKRVELNLLFKKISTTIFEISITNLMGY